MRKTLEERFWSKVEKTETCWEWTGNRSIHGYGRIYRDGALRFAHRYSIELSTGRAPTLAIDHMCHVKHCVNPGHLREVTTKQNMENRPGPSSRNTSGYRGVSWHKESGMWQAKVTHGGRQYFLGRFEDPAEADAVATAKRNELFTHNEVDRRAA
jgi:hypothetical protein